jgi:hypothetical protein
MANLQVIESELAGASYDELLEVEKLLNEAKEQKRAKKVRSLLDLKPRSLGGMLAPLPTREEMYDEMLEDKIK